MTGEIFPDLGEVWGAPRPWVDGDFPLPVPGTADPCGSAVVWEHGWPGPNPVGLTRNDYGLSTCCGGVMWPPGDFLLVFRPGRWPEHINIGAGPTLNFLPGHRTGPLIKFSPAAAGLTGYDEVCIMPGITMLVQPPQGPTLAFRLQGLAGPGPTLDFLPDSRFGLIGSGPVIELFPDGSAPIGSGPVLKLFPAASLTLAGSGPLLKLFPVGSLPIGTGLILALVPTAPLTLAGAVLFKLFPASVMPDIGSGPIMDFIPNCDLVVPAPPPGTSCSDAPTMAIDTDYTYDLANTPAWFAIPTTAIGHGDPPNIHVTVTKNSGVDFDFEGWGDCPVTTFLGNRSVTSTPACLDWGGNGSLNYIQVFPLMHTSGIANYTIRFGSGVC